MCFAFSGVDLLKAIIFPNLMNKKLVSLLIAAGLVLGASRSFAAAVNITVADNDPVATSFGGGPFGQGLEDNETEHLTSPGQQWDMEAFVISGSTLYIVGGYNMLAGEAGYKPGDLFIKVGGSNPGFQPLAITPGTVDNSAYGYSYVVDLTQPVGATGALASVYSLASGSLFDTVALPTAPVTPTAMRCSPLSASAVWWAVRTTSWRLTSASSRSRLARPSTSATRWNAATIR